LAKQEWDEAYSSSQISHFIRPFKLVHASASHHSPKTSTLWVTCLRIILPYPTLRFREKASSRTLKLSLHQATLPPLGSLCMHKITRMGCCHHLTGRLADPQTREFGSAAMPRWQFLGSSGHWTWGAGIYLLQ